MYFNGNTHPGKQRKENQDAFGCHILWDKHKVLLLVVDGVGGYAGGEEAAKIARISIETYMQTPKGDLLTMLREAVIHANNRIVEERKNNPGFFEMCCVLTAAVADLQDEKVHFVHVGDTRLYRFRNGALQKLTRDHSFVGIREDAGELTEAEAMKHPQRNQILREAGSAFHRIDDEDFLDYGTRDFISGDQLLLCSDGLTDMITAKQISDVLATRNAVAVKVNTLIRLANDMGGFDNITVVMMQNNRKPIRLTKKPPTAATSASDPKDEKTDPKTTNALAGFPVKKVLLRSILLLIFFAGTSWYFLTIHEDPESGVQTLPHKQVQVKDTSKNQLLFAIRSANPAVPVPPQPLLPDTFRISSTCLLNQLQDRSDSLRNTLIILPTGKGNFAAAKVTDSFLIPGDTLQIRNLHFSNFETGIELHSTIPLKLENVVFDQVSNPLRQKKATSKSEKKLLTSLNP